MASRYPQGGMDDGRSTISRRDVFVTGGLGVIAAIALANPTKAGALSASEKANVKIVNDLCASFPHPDKTATFLAEDSKVRLSSDAPVLIGPAAALAAFKSYQARGETVSAKILSTRASGPVVMNTRIDTVSSEGKPDQQARTVGVFVVKDGKIREWTDFGG